MRYRGNKVTRWRDGVTESSRYRVSVLFGYK